MVTKKQTDFHCVVVTPERVVLERAAEFAALPAWDAGPRLPTTTAPEWSWVARSSRG